MLTIKTETVSNVAYTSMVALVATVEGYEVKVSIMNCTPKFRLIGVDEEYQPEVYSSLEYATTCFWQEVAIQQTNAKGAYSAEQSALKRCLSPANLEYERRMQEIMGGLSDAVPLELKPEEGTVYLYHGLTVHEFSPDEESIAVSLSLNGEVIWEEFTSYDGGYFISPELAIYQYFS
jgi:hypothetical protein